MVLITKEVGGTRAVVIITFTEHSVWKRRHGQSLGQDFRRDGSQLMHALGIIGVFRRSLLF